MSPAEKVSPSFNFQVAMPPSVMVGDIAGIVNLERECLAAEEEIAGRGRVRERKSARSKSGKSRAMQTSTRGHTGRKDSRTLDEAEHRAGGQESSGQRRQEEDDTRHRKQQISV
jgi:hypothetical protein